MVYGLKVCLSDTMASMISPLLQFGRRVQKLRKGRKLSQENLAELADLHRNYVSQIECGRRNVSLLNILKIGRALKVRASKLIEDLR
jgi:transcriptional regulator with XRE-family HTH domain